MLIERYISNSGAVVIAFYVLFFSIALMFKYSNKNALALVGAFLSNRSFDKKTQEEYFIRNYVSILFFVVGLISISLALFFVFNESLSNDPLEYFLTPLVYFIIRIAAIYFFSNVISSRANVLKPILHYEVLFVQLLGLVLSFVLIMQLWLNQTQQLIIVFSIMGIAIIYKWIKQLRISFLAHISLFYIILYFCALEIIPLLFLIKRAKLF